MKVIKADGTYYYYYYKKKRGRKKKRGPKKSVKAKSKVDWTKRFNYKILRCDFRKQTDYIGVYNTAEEAGKVKELLLKMNSEVQLPVKYVNNKKKSIKPFDLVSEYIIVKRNRDGEKPVTKLRNDFGKLVDNDTTSDVWYIIDKFPCLVEETFWVFGRNPRNDRVTISQFCDEYITQYLSVTNDNIIVVTYNNKVLLSYDNGELAILFTKNVQDGIRVYNYLEDRFRCVRRVFFTGFVNGKNERGRYFLRRIKEKTGWDYAKIYKKTTVY